MVGYTSHLQPLAYYIQRRRHTVHNTIRGRDVLKECEGAERRRGTPSRLFWAEHARVRVATQVRPTIAEEWPREAMPVTTATMEARWWDAYINY